MKLELTPEWDKTFPRNEEVEHAKATFANRYGIELACDVYKPAAAQGKLSAIAISGPFGAVKEQASGLYAQELASRGFLTIAFDPSFTGESAGSPRYMASPDINTEDFLAAVDYLSNREDVDADKIGILGICGWGGMAVNAAALDPRIKATAAMTMYDMSRVNAKGYFDSEDNAEKRWEKKRALAEERTAAFARGEFVRAGGVIDPVPEEAPQFVKDYHDYYKTDRGYHPRSLNSNGGWTAVGCQSFLNQPLLSYAGEIKAPVLLVHGEKAHSCYFSKSTYELLEGDNKELMLIEGAVHVDLYDNYDYIPFEKLQEFFQKPFA